MEFIRKITNSNKLSGIIKIPEEMKNKDVEIIIRPYESPEKTEQKKTKSLKGTLSKYKDTKLISKESQAFSQAIFEKHEKYLSRDPFLNTDQ